MRMCLLVCCDGSLPPLSPAPGGSSLLLLLSHASSRGVVGLLCCPASAAGQARRFSSARRRRHAVASQHQHICQQSVAHQSPLLCWVRLLFSAHVSEWKHCSLFFEPGTKKINIFYCLIAHTSPAGRSCTTMVSVDCSFLSTSFWHIHTY